MLETERVSLRLRNRIPLKVSIKTIVKGMTRVRRRLIEDFLLPALNDRRYGDRLKWEDKEKNCFSIRWSHKNAAKWSLDDTVVFQDWDRMKGHFRPECKGYYMQAKQRFRAALYKLATVKVLTSDDKHVKKYELILGNEKRKHPGNSTIKTRSKKFCPSLEAQRSIPTSVICRNDSYYKQQPKFDYDHSPQSPASSTKSDYSNYNDDSLDSAEDNGCNHVKQELLNGGSVIESTESTFAELTNANGFNRTPSNCVLEMVPIKSEPIDDYETTFIEHEPTDNDYRMASVKCEPLDDYETALVKCESPDINFEMTPVKCEPADNSSFETTPLVQERTSSDSISSVEGNLLESSQFRTMQPTTEKTSITEIKVEALPITDEILRTFAPKLRAKYLSEKSKIFPLSKITIFPNIPREIVQNSKSPENHKNYTSGKNGFISHQNLSPSKVRNLVPHESKISSTPVVNRSSPHVPIPPLPGYSKTDIAVKPLDNNQRRVYGNRLGNKSVENKFMLVTKDTWSGMEPPMSADGALNLCTKSVKHFNENSICADR